ncbi:MAG: peptide chain release factor N(5)-glutamine methyltransferase [Bacteroidota bacterium]|jgi:release factor glutamine methyltransferase
MFVSDNSLKSAKHYFDDRLQSHFSTSELKSMWTQIICKRLNWTSSDLLLNQNERLSESDLLYVRRFVKGLLAKKPFQYIIGETEFYGLTILCDSRALIPRPETEELVQWVIESVKEPKRIIDLCSGTGCISLALKSRFPTAHVQAIDFSDEALKLSEENAKKLKLDIEIIHENVLDFSHAFISNNANFDVIVSNPPYIPNKEKSMLSKHVIEHEPAMALFVEDSDPIIFYKEIIKYAEMNLQRGGLLFFELHESYGNEVLEFIQLFDFEEIEIRPDLQGKSRMMKAQKV